MILSDLTQRMRLDLGDSEAATLDDGYLLRAMDRAVVAVNQDLGTAYLTTLTTLVSDPPADHLEALLIKARVCIYQMMQTQAAGAFSFTSGDKKVDKTAQADAYADLVAQGEKAYKEKVKAIKPDYQDPGSDLFLPNFHQPAVFEQAVEA